MEVILDTNFVISCVLKKIDFLEELVGMGFNPRIPREVLQEMKDLKKENKTGRKEREAIDLAFEILDKNKIKKVGVGGRYVDEGLIAKGKQGIFIATLDRAIKREVPNRIVIENSKKRLMIDRN